MCSEKEVGICANGLADAGAECDAALQILGYGLVTAHDRVGTGGVELDGCIAFCDGGHGRLCRQIGRGVEGARVLILTGIQIGVGPHGICDPATEKGVNRAVPRLANDIPAGDLKP